MKKETTDSFRMGLQGIYKVAVVDGISGQEIWKQENWGKNLILNQGMDRLASDYLANVTTYGVAGTGTRFNNVASGDSSGSVIGGVFGLTTGATGIQDLNSTTYGGWVGGVLAVGDVIRFYDGTEINVVGSIGASTATVTPTATIATQSFAIWKTSQTTLQTEVKRGGAGIAGSSYLVGTGNCGSSAVNNVVQYLRTYDFSTESVQKTYTEVGVAWDTDDAPIKSTFSRILLPQTLSIDVDQRLRLIYQLDVVFTPESASGVINATISGWPVAPATNTNMSQSIQLMTRVSSINTSGVATTTYASLEPPAIGNNCSFFASTNSQSLVSLDSTPVNRNALGTADIASSTADSYTAGSYIVYKNATFALGQMNYTNLASFGFGANNPSATLPYNALGQAFAMLFNQTQSKYSSQTLTMTYKWTWGRTLST